MNFTKENPFLTFILLISKVSTVDSGPDNRILSKGWLDWCELPSLGWEFLIRSIDYNWETQSHTYLLSMLCTKELFLKKKKNPVNVLSLSFILCIFYVMIKTPPACRTYFLNAKIEWNERKRKFGKLPFVVKCLATHPQDVHKGSNWHLFGTTQWSASAAWDLGQGGACASV